MCTHGSERSVGFFFLRYAQERLRSWLTRPNCRGESNAAFGCPDAAAGQGQLGNRWLALARGINKREDCSADGNWQPWPGGNDSGQFGVVLRFTGQGLGQGRFRCRP